MNFDHFECFSFDWRVFRGRGQMEALLSILTILDQTVV